MKITKSNEMETEIYYIICAGDNLDLTDDYETIKSMIERIKESVWKLDSLVEKKVAKESVFRRQALESDKYVEVRPGVWDHPQRNLSNK